MNSNNFSPDIINLMMVVVNLNDFAVVVFFLVLTFGAPKCSFSKRLPITKKFSVSNKIIHPLYFSTREVEITQSKHFDWPRYDTFIARIPSDNECSPEVSRQVLDIAQSLSKIWKDCDPNYIQFRRINIALTNKVYIVTNLQRNLESDDPSQILIRLYGSSSWMLERGIEETAAIILSHRGIIPSWYGTFSNGRIEEYVDCDPVSASTFRSAEVSVMLIKKLSIIHSFYEDIVSSTTMRDCGITLCSGTDYLWDRMDTWAAKAATSLSAIQKQTKWKNFRHLSDEIESISAVIFGQDDTIMNLRREAESLGGADDIVFAHCDLHHGNVIKLRDKPSDEYLIIDYEYALPTTRAYDLANFIWEFCSDFSGLDPAEYHSEYFPDKEARASLLAAYLTAAREGEAYDCNITDVEAAVAVLDKQVLAYTPFVHLHWGHWALIKAAESEGQHTTTIEAGVEAADTVDAESIGFNYLKYAQQRYNEVAKFLEKRANGCMYS